jgi:hypothetical protein
MKLRFLLILLALPFFLQAQTPELRKFYRQHKKGDGVTKVALPGWIVKMGVGIAGEQLGEEKELVKKLVKPLRGFRVLTVENGPQSYRDQIPHLLKSAKKRKFKDLIMVRDTETAVQIMFKDKYKKRKKKRIIKRLVIVVADGEEFVLVSIRGRWNLQKIMKEVQSLDFIKEKAKIPFPKPKNPMPQA